MSSATTGCNICNTNYRIADGHRCTVSSLQFALRESRAYAVRLEAKLRRLVKAGEQVLADVDDDGVAEAHDVAVHELRLALKATELKLLRNL